LIGLALIALLVLLTRVARASVATVRNVSSVFITAAVLSCFAVATVNANEKTNTNAVQSSAYADDSDIGYRRIQRHVYLGAGLGLSHLDPDDSVSTGFDVNDRVQNAGQLLLGVDLSKHIAAELHGTLLGSAGFSPEGSIAYNVIAGSALTWCLTNKPITHIS